MSVVWNFLQIIAEGVRGSSFRGDIAIDDFKIFSGVSCQITPLSASPNAPTTSAPLTTAAATTTPPREFFYLIFLSFLSAVMFCTFLKYPRWCDKAGVLFDGLIGCCTIAMLFN